MNNLQKETILTLQETDKMNSNYTNNYWFSYKDYLDPADNFTDFCCECLEFLCRSMEWKIKTGL